jgi:catechol 2,3-dioxygenase-like lactoylglutathione lyase family enzyme
MALPTRLSLITIGTRDHARMRAFYIDLGWPVGVDIEGDLTSFLLGGVVLALWPLDLLTTEAAPGSAPPGIGWSGITLACNCDSREEVDTAFAAALAAGASVVAEPVDREWGGRSGYFADPEGNRWEVAWAPGMQFDARGSVTRFGGE